MSLDAKFAKHLKRAYTVDDAGRAGDAHDYTLPPAFPFIHRLVHGYTLLYRSESENMARLLAIKPPSTVTPANEPVHQGSSCEPAPPHEGLYQDTRLQQVATPHPTNHPPPPPVHP